MNKKILVSAIILLSLILISTVNADELFSEYTNGGSWYGMNFYYSSNGVASGLWDNSFNLTTIAFRIRKTGTPNAFVSVKVFNGAERWLDINGATNGVEPAINYVASSITHYDVNTLTTSSLGEWVNFTFSGELLYNVSSYWFIIYYVNATTVNTSNRCESIYLQADDYGFLGSINNFDYPQTYNRGIDFKVYGNTFQFSSGSDDGYTDADLEENFIFGGVVALLIGFLLILALKTKR